MKIYILGETTYDIIFKDNKPIEAKVGGSQLNTAVSLGRMQLPVSFITQFGSDVVGDICASFIKENGINDSFIKRNRGTSRVALAFLNENNDAAYNFYKAENSSPFIFPEVKENDIILFGSTFALRSDIREELSHFLRDAKAKNALIIYDPNIRRGDIATDQKKLNIILENFQLATIVKGSDDDFVNIFGFTNSDDVWDEISKSDVKCLFYTANKNGVKIHLKKSSLFLTVPVIHPVSTIGAGDNFNAGLIYSVFTKGIELKRLPLLTDEDLSQIAKVAILFAQEVCLSYENYISAGFAEELSRENRET
jgi:fructokinase